MRRILAGRRPSPALVVSVVALVVALAGTSMALPGTSSVNRNDQVKNQRTDWAVVSAAGGIIAQSGGISIDNHAVGGTHMRFPVLLGTRPIAATIHGGLGVTGQISATRCGTTPPGGEGCSGGLNQRHIFVKTTDSAGNNADRKFIVTVLPR